MTGAALALATLAAFAQPEPTCGPVADIAELVPAFRGTPGSPLRRTHHLLRRFSEGDGELERTPTPVALRSGVGLYPFPWELAPERRERAQLVTWSDPDRDHDENMPAILLNAGESWCTSALDWEPGAALRFDALAIGMSDGTLRVESAGSVLFDGGVPAPGRLSSETQRTLALPGRSGPICFHAEGGAVAIGEARLVASDLDAADTRPRWVVITIFDSLRGDLVREGRAERVMPTLHALSASGRTYERAISPGCHTRASVFPTLSGRDLMRIDPLKRRQSVPVESPLEDVYARGNLHIGHLADAAGYHPVYLGNNAYMRTLPAFARYSNWSGTETRTAELIRTLPDVFARYADERVLLVFYVSAPHAHSTTPKRWFEALECGVLTGIEQCRCQYEARARYADEALGALRSGLEHYALDNDVVQVVTADHGELFEEGAPIEGEMPTFATGARRGAFSRFDRGHGNSCHALESDVPLVLAGRGVGAGRTRRPVSGLDVAPTLIKMMTAPTPGLLDGVPLPMGGTDDAAGRRFVSYGFCSDAMDGGDERLIWWTQGCRLRTIDARVPLDIRSELWRDGKRVATEETDPARLRTAMRRHEDWLRNRLESEALVFRALNLDETVVTVDVDGGRITDYGPASTVYGLEGIRRTALSRDGRRLTVELRRFEGLYRVVTMPPTARVRVTSDAGVETAAGPLRISTPEDGWLDPAARPSYLLSDGTPRGESLTARELWVWWVRY